MAKENAPKSAPKKKKTTQKKAAPKKTAAKKTAAKKNTTQKKTTAAKTKKTAKSDRILLRAFDKQAPETLYTPEPIQNDADFTAPPFKASDAENDAIRPFLDKKFDMTLTAEEAAKVQEILASAETVYQEKLAAIAEAKQKAEEEARIKAEEEAKKKAEEEARIKAEEEAKKKAEEEEEAKKKAEEEARIKAEEEAKKKAEEEARIKAEEEAKEKSAINKPLVMTIGGFCLLVIVLFGSSAYNTGNYYVKPTNSGIEIWKGEFSPLGERLLVKLPGLHAPESIKAVYKKREVLPVVFNYFMAQVDELKQSQGIPDFVKMESLLNTAAAYATSEEERQAVAKDLESIQSIITQFKAAATEAAEVSEAVSVPVSEAPEADASAGNTPAGTAAHEEAAAAEPHHADKAPEETTAGHH